MVRRSNNVPSLQQLQEQCEEHNKISVCEKQWSLVFKAHKYNKKRKRCIDAIKYFDSIGWAMYEEGTTQVISEAITGDINDQARFASTVEGKSAIRRGDGAIR